MRRRQFMVTGLLASSISGLWCMGCTKPMTAETEYIEGTDFSRYETYRWITDDLILIQSGTGNPQIRNVENERRIRAAVERELERDGLTKVTNGDADLVLAFTVGTKVRYQIQGGATTLDLVTAEPASITQGRLTVYVFDHATQQQIWSASTKKNLEPGTDPDAVIDAAVSVLMAEFDRVRRGPDESAPAD